MSAMSLTEFLLARIGEDEARAKVATPGPWGDPDEDFGYGDFGWHVYGCPAGETEDSERGRADIKFIAHNHPARVLAECEAKRRIVERHVDDGFSDTECSWCGSSVGWPCPDLLDLALPYADHPEFQEAWNV